MDKQKIYNKMYIMAGYRNLFQFVIILLFVFSVGLAAADSKNVSAYKGTFSGIWGGDCLGTYVGGTFTMSISADGIVSGTYAIGDAEGGTLSGTVGSDGTFNAKGLAKDTVAAVEWSGKIYISDGVLSGKGYWKSSSGNGTWNSK